MRQPQRQQGESSACTRICLFLFVGLPPPSASLSEKTKHGRRWRRPPQLHQEDSSADACPGCDWKTTPTWSKVCVRLAGPADGIPHRLLRLSGWRVPVKDLIALGECESKAGFGYPPR